MADKKISELNNVSGLNLTDLFVLSQIFGNDWVSKNATLLQLANAINNGIDYTSDLQTTSKKPIGAINENKSSIDNLISIIDSLYPVNIASGAIANFTTSLAKPLTELTSTIVAQQASGTPTPSSPLPISGFSSVKFGQTSGSAEFAPFFRGVLQGAYSFVDLGSLSWTYSNSAFISEILTSWGSIGSVGSSNPLICPNYSTKSTRNWAATYSNNECGLSVDGKQIIVKDSNYSDATSFETAMSGVYAIYELKEQVTPAITAEQFATLCTAFGIDGNIITVALGQTVYGGSVDAKSGKATITHAIIDLGALTWNYNSTYSLFYCDAISDCSLNPTDCKCSSYDFNASANGTSLSSMSGNLTDLQMCAFSNQNNRGRFVIKDSSYTDADIFTTAVTGQKLVYTLQTPVEIDITANNFTTIVGEQNIFSDCGEVSISFKQTVQEYIDAKIAETQALVLNS